MTNFFVLTFCILGALAAAYGVGYSSAMLAVQDSVFRPWLDSLKPGTSTYWARAAEYEVAWNRYVAAHHMLRPFRRWLMLPVPDSRRDIAAG